MTDAASPLLPLLQQVLLARDIACTVEGSELVLDSGLHLAPHAMAAEPRDNGGWQTSTVIEARHPELFADGLFEYQHAAGDSQKDATLSGFENWVRVDLATLQAAIGADDAPELQMLTLRYGAEETGTPLARAVVLGPLAHYRSEPADEAPACSDGDHGSCPCCLFTQSLDAFNDLLKTRQFLGIRLFASRDADGQCEADCRVNGHDFPAALPLLRAYAARWPQAGLEFRKQYVVVRNDTDD
ncbi:hypothetical protein C1924_03615 [Stenotrophomonas sp. ESTM1D_MKCIP4_1]|uniref:DUF6348 family protein n=1 Tax=Stenotrophomonas sp. ESTM1D_MKCIP4_1 TaxID=2072414 RepID=UPI000D53C59A|nr:DUF6348 family protein [Stenotrophomonas sp. ESTM1D_MKCIP4_1]AWH52340.1 hypothetical protein C1924_03615 [Stenotrophomonas sp. ESTM1D_MKCIP4_1]